MASQERARKIAVVGSSAVGKSSVTATFVGGKTEFPEAYYPTIENQFSKEVDHNGIKYVTEIIDTAGQDEFSIMSQKLLIGIHGYMLVFSVASRNSFDMIPIIRDKILNSTGVDALPMVLVGNKIDLGDGQRAVSAQEAQSLAAEMSIPYVETSAKQGLGIDKAFQALIGQIENTKPDKSQDASKCIIS